MPKKFLIIVAALVLFTGCMSNDAPRANTDAANANTESAKPAMTPSKSFTADDIAKLKWIEGTWRGMDGDKPFFERYKLEGTTLVVDTLTDKTLSKVEDTGRFELKDGEFGQGEGDKRTVASSITEDSIQFVPAVPGKANNFRFERQGDGTWNAVLEWPATADMPVRKKSYKMEPWPEKK